MDNRDCIWCSEPCDGKYYCSFDEQDVKLCDIYTPCKRYCRVNHLPDFLRQLILKCEELSELMVKLP